MISNDSSMSLQQGSTGINDSQWPQTSSLRGIYRRGERKGGSFILAAPDHFAGSAGTRIHGEPLHLQGCFVGLCRHATCECAQHGGVEGVLVALGCRAKQHFFRGQMALKNAAKKDAVNECFLTLSIIIEKISILLAMRLKNHFFHSGCCMRSHAWSCNSCTSWGKGKT